MRYLEELLGFRVSGSPNSRKVELLSSEGKQVKAVRPATPQEVDLWQALLGQEEGMRVAGDSVQRWMHEATQARADANSLKASCEAYRQQLQRLHDFVAHQYPIQPTDDVIEYVMDLLVGKRSLGSIQEVEAKHFPGDPMNSMLAEELEKVQARSAGRRVRDNPQA